MESISDFETKMNELHKSFNCITEQYKQLKNALYERGNSKKEDAYAILLERFMQEIHDNIYNYRQSMVFNQSNGLTQQVLDDEAKLSIWLSIREFFLEFCQDGILENEDWYDFLKATRENDKEVQDDD